jgi:hypothetical protein
MLDEANLLDRRCRICMIRRQSASGVLAGMERS